MSPGEADARPSPFQLNRLQRLAPADRHAFLEYADDLNARRVRSVSYGGIAVLAAASLLNARLVDAMGGTIACHAREGGGTTFEVRLIAT